GETSGGPGPVPRTQMYGSDVLREASAQAQAQHRLVENVSQPVAEPRSQGNRLEGTPITVVTEGVETTPPYEEPARTHKPPAPAVGPASDRWRQDPPFEVSSFFRY